jgi:hypothetical protein
LGLRRRIRPMARKRVADMTEVEREHKRAQTREYMARKYAENPEPQRSAVRRRYQDDPEHSNALKRARRRAQTPEQLAYRQQLERVCGARSRARRRAQRAALAEDVQRVHVVLIGWCPEHPEVSSVPSPL